MTQHGDPWRWRCPNGHTHWRAVQSGGYVCRSCQAHPDYDEHHFDELVDARELSKDD